MSRSTGGYHHGNLQAALEDAALDLLETTSAAKISLREVARRAGVSHNAPYHHFGDRAALVDADGRPTSYADLDRRSDAVAAGLIARGLGPGDVVALTLASGVEWVVLAAACAKAGPATAGVNPGLARGERQACVDLAEPALVVTHADEVAALERAGADLAPPPPIDDPERAIVNITTPVARPVIPLNTAHSSAPAIASGTRLERSASWAMGTCSASAATEARATRPSAVLRSIPKSSRISGSRIPNAARSSSSTAFSPNRITSG